jgi:hypothetical protein
MGYLGAVGPAYDPTRATVPQLDAERFNGDNSTVAFTLLRQVVSPTDVDVFVENVRQEPIVAYSINSTTLTFTEAPQTGTNNIYVIYRGSGVSNYAFVPDGSISYAKLANNIRQFSVDNFSANGTGTTFTLSETPATANTVMVAIDGVVQTPPSNYSVSGTTLILTSAPAASANVTVRHLGFRTTATVTALSASSVTATELAAGSVTNAKLAGSITSDKISTVNGSSLIANTIPVNTVSGNVIVANTMSNSAFTTGSIEAYMRAQSLDFGLRNRIINGDMRIDQRNVGANTTPTDNAYTLDRWHTQVSQTAKMTIQKMDSANSSATGYEANSAPAGFANSLKVTSLSGYSVGASDYFAVDQCIEAFNLIDLNWGTANAKSVTLSFWVKSSLTGTFGGSVTNGAFNRSYPFTYTIVAANTWEQKFVVIPGDTTGTYGTTNGRGIYVQFGLGAGSTYGGTAGSWSANGYVSATGGTSVVGTNAATWYITGVQLEEGSQATPFEYRHYGTELQLCQRYYQKWVYTLNSNMAALGLCTSTSSVVANFPLYFPMRTEPTVTIPTSGTGSGQWGFLTSGGTYPGTIGTITADKIETFSFRLQNSGSTSAFTQGNACWLYPNNGNPTVTASAEL